MEPRIVMSGYVGTPVEYRVGDGYAYASFRLAHTPRTRRHDRWVDGETTWITVEAANRLAENVKLSVLKGEPVLVAGQLRTQRWQGRDSEARERMVLRADAIGHDLARCQSRTVPAPGDGDGDGELEPGAAPAAQPPEPALSG